MRESTGLVRQFREHHSTQADEDDWNEFNDINKIVRRHSVFLRDSCPSHDDVGGLFVDFGAGSDDAVASRHEHYRETERA